MQFPQESKCHWSTFCFTWNCATDQIWLFVANCGCNLSTKDPKSRGTVERGIEDYKLKWRMQWKWNENENEKNEMQHKMHELGLWEGVSADVFVQTSPQGPIPSPPPQECQILCSQIAELILSWGIYQTILLKWQVMIFGHTEYLLWNRSFYLHWLFYFYAWLLIVIV